MGMLVGIHYGTCIIVFRTRLYLLSQINGLHMMGNTLSSLYLLCRKQCKYSTVYANRSRRKVFTVFTDDGEVDSVAIEEANKLQSIVITCNFRVSNFLKGLIPKPLAC